MFSSENIKRNFLIRPYTYIAPSLLTMSLKLLSFFLVQVALLILGKSYHAVAVVLCATVASVLAELLTLIFTHQKLTSNNALLVSVLQGLIAGLLIPESCPLAAVFLVVFGVMLIAGSFFGGYAFTWINTSIFSVVVLWIVGARIFPPYLVSMDMLALRNPSLQLIESGAVPLVPADSVITEFLNGTVFSLFKVSVPEGYVSLFWDSHSAIPAFRYNFVNIVASVLFFSDTFFELIVPGIFLLSYGILVRFVSPFIYAGIPFQGDLLLAFLTGGTLFCAFFVIGWYGMTPITVGGKIAYAGIAGLLFFLIAGCGTSPAGMVFTVLSANVVSVLIQQAEQYRERRKVRRQIAALSKENEEALQRL